MIVAQETVDALGHTEVVDAAVAATCTTAGKTEGKHCSVCGEVTVAQTAIAALGHDFAQDICKNCGIEFPKYTDWDFDKQIVTHQSFDELFYGAGRTGIFTPGQSAGWNKIVNYTAEMATLNYWGWIGVKGTLGQFGYQIDANEAIFSAGFAFATEQGVIDAAKPTGADTASRMLIPINLGGLSAGAHTVNVLYKTADGSIVALCVFSVLVPDANGQVPSKNPTAIYTADQLVAAPINNATASKVDNYAHIVTGTVNGSVDPVIGFAAEGNGFSDIIVIKYRTNCGNYGSNYWGYFNYNGDLSTKFIGNRADSDNWFKYESDGEWHTLVLNMRKNKASNTAMANTDITGGANINQIIFNIFDYTKKGTVDGQTEYFDIEYIAFFETKADAYAYIG